MHLAARKAEGCLEQGHEEANFEDQAEQHLAVCEVIANVVLQSEARPA